MNHRSIPATPRPLRMALVALLVALAIGGLVPRSASALDQIVICELPNGEPGTCVISCTFNPDADPLIPDLGEWHCTKVPRRDEAQPDPNPPPPDPPEPEGEPQTTGSTQVQALEGDVDAFVPSGIGGGGTIRTASSDAQFAISATRIAPVTMGDGTTQVTRQAFADSAPLVRGQIVWTATTADGAPLVLTSVLVDEYGWIEDVSGGRWARGTMAVNGEGEIPFVLRAVDGGTPGTGQDTIELSVGNTIEGHENADFGYHAEGSLASGDLQLLGLAFDSPQNAGS